ncbi:MAG: tRNA (adenosine(37)-N6)-threonylcarbamoyltransferase complex ATPase subunit type 1 TsaE [candidate division Zixibacteria bacterium]|nr:tRNA (adenosine(37)-N6)-threonylcarbamoyltransferase complex ATPase subunit type 1 TsaE [candidate division Zixibacteria bacterium]
MTDEQIFHSLSEEQTRQLGYEFASGLSGGDVVSFSGELGAGKTVFIRGICDRLCPEINVSSPSFTIVNVYPTEGFEIYHIDFYRISDESELIDLGIEEYFDPQNIVLIEWGEKGDKFLPENTIKIELSILGESERRVKIKR